MKIKGLNEYSKPPPFYINGLEAFYSLIDGLLRLSPIIYHPRQF
jgi:hypothetical protein